MGVRDCLVEAAENGVITREEASSLIDEFEERFAQARFSLDDSAAAAVARKELEESLRASAIETRRRANLTDAARLQVKDRLQSFRDNEKPNVLKAAIGVLSHYGFRGSSSVRGRQEAIISMAHGKLTDLMWTFQRSAVLGRRNNKPMIAEIVRELKGEATGNETAKAFARSVGEVFEDLRQRFNNAGGAIPKLEGWGLPQTHNAGRIRQAGRADWKKNIVPLLDPNRMLDALTKKPVGAEGLSRALDHVYDSIVSQGWANKVPTMVARGRGALATQRQDARFLVFKNAEAWQTYNATYGRGDALQGIFEHINGMARDIAAMEIMGPNPEAMLKYMKNVVAHEYGKQLAGKPSLARQGILKDSAITAAQYRLDSLYQYLRGRPEVVSGFARAVSDVKNVVTAAVLGSASLLAGATDPFIAAAARRLAGLPAVSTMTDVLKMIKGQNRKDIIRAGVIWEEYLHLMNDEARFAGIVLGSDWSKFLVDRSVMFSGLKPLTTGRKLVEARAWQAHLSDNAGKEFSQLETRLRTAMEGFGIDASDWSIMRQAVDENGFITPMEIARQGGEVRYINMNTATPEQIVAETKALKYRDIAEKLAELTSSWSERSVPTGTPNARSIISGTTERGTLAGELVDTALQFKSFGLSFTSLQIEALQQLFAQAGVGRPGAANAGKYMVSMVIPMTIGAAMYIQLKHLADGKDLADMTSPEFWFRAMIQGGGFGLFGDYLAATENRFGQGIAESIVGPGLSFGGDVVNVTASAIMQALGSDRNTGRETIRFAQRYTPFLSSHWATRGAYRRMILDQLQMVLDPQADKAFKMQVVRAKKDGQDYWWKPGRTAPSRAPRF